MINLDNGWLEAGCCCAHHGRRFPLRGSLIMSMYHDPISSYYNFMYVLIDSIYLVCNMFEWTQAVVKARNVFPLNFFDCKPLLRIRIFCSLYIFAVGESLARFPRTGLQHFCNRKSRSVIICAYKNSVKSCIHKKS